MSFQVAYIPVGVGTFHLESARTEFEKSKNMISQLTGEGVYPDKMLLTLEDLDTFLDRIHPDLIILQNITFANAAYELSGAEAVCVSHSLVDPAGAGHRRRKTAA